MYLCKAPRFEDFHAVITLQDFLPDLGGAVDFVFAQRDSITTTYHDKNGKYTLTRETSRESGRLTHLWGIKEDAQMRFFYRTRSNRIPKGSDFETLCITTDVGHGLRETAGLGMRAIVMQQKKTPRVERKKFSINDRVETRWHNNALCSRWYPATVRDVMGLLQRSNGTTLYLKYDDGSEGNCPITLEEVRMMETHQVHITEESIGIVTNADQENAQILKITTVNAGGLGERMGLEVGDTVTKLVPPNFETVEAATMGTKMQVYSPTGVWRSVTILWISGWKVKIHYDTFKRKWDSKNNEWIECEEVLLMNQDAKRIRGSVPPKVMLLMLRGMERPFRMIVTRQKKADKEQPKVSLR